MKQLPIVLACLAASAFAQAPGTAAVPPAVAPDLPAPVTQPAPPSRWSVAQVREAFQLADVNGDGQLTRGEAQRVAIMPRSFEDADLNKDGVLTLDEYRASFATP